MDFNGLFTLALITIFSFTVAAQESTASISETILTTEEVTSTSGLSEETVPPTFQTPVKIQPRTQTRINDPNGLLCEPDNDEIGRHLGCSCANLTVGGIVTADCSEKWIGMKNISLPHRMNISRHVRILDLSKNELTFVDEDTFGDCDSLFSLILHKNHIQEIQGLHCKWLKKLDLSWNNIQGLSNDAFQNLTRLQELDLSYNNLLFVEPKALDQLHLLRTLNLASNPLGKELNYADDYTLALDNLINLTELDMSNCSFPDFPLSLITGSVNLKRLVLRNNQISSLSDGLLHQLSELTELDLSGNWFETITPQMFLGLQSLRFLRIDKMPFLKTIEAHAFAGLISLDELSCQKNHYLTLIDPMAFRLSQEKEEDSADCHPKAVKLGDNNLNFIDYGLLIWKNLEMLELYRNPWICDCNLQWVAEFYRKRTEDAAILADSDFTCAEPHIFAGLTVVNVDPDEMLCYSPAATIAGTVGIILFGFLMFSFCSVIILNHMGILPEWVRRYNIFGSGSSLPKYMRVNPKPTRARRLERLGVSATEPVPGDLEWDSADIGPT